MCKLFLTINDSNKGVRDEATNLVCMQTGTIRCMGIRRPKMLSLYVCVYDREGAFNEADAQRL